MKFSLKGKVIIQGIMEPLGQWAARQMQAYGTPLVAGISPGHGSSFLGGVPVFDLVEEIATLGEQVDTSVIFSPPYEVLDAGLEAIAMGIRHLVIVTPRVPPLDMVSLVRRAEATETLVLGPNSPGLVIPGQTLLGIHPPSLYQRGFTGLVSSAVSLTYEVALTLTGAGLGQSLVVGIGGDSIPGSTISQWLQILDEDEDTGVIVVVGQVEDRWEEHLADHIAATIYKPVVVYLAGHLVRGGNISYPPASPMPASTYPWQPSDPQQRLTQLGQSGVLVANCLQDIPHLVRQAAPGLLGE